MYAVVGLGNPGPDYAATRHNAGFAVADALADRWGLRLRLIGTRAQAGETEVDGRRVMIVKPLTYMNRSGAVVRELLDPGPVETVEKLLIVVDEAALPTGTMRIRPRGSDGGHNGLGSIERSLGTAEYPRLRIGVGPPPDGDFDLAEFVLDRFEDDDAERFVHSIPTIMDAVDCWMSDGIEIAMNRFNRKAPAE